MLAHEFPSLIHMHNRIMLYENSDPQQGIIAYQLHSIYLHLLVLTILYCVLVDIINYLYITLIWHLHSSLNIYSEE